LISTRFLPLKLGNRKEKKRGHAPFFARMTKWKGKIRGKHPIARKNPKDA